MFQSAAFATGLPPDLYAFHRYTGNSALLSHPLAEQSPLHFPGWARRFHGGLTQPPTLPVRPVNPNNACHLRITAAAGTKLAVAASGGTVQVVPTPSSLPKGVYNPKTFIPHAASLRQTFVHCAIFLTAASRRSLARVAVPVWLIVLSDQLPVEALVSRYLTNKLIGHEPIHVRNTHGIAFFPKPKFRKRMRY